jgi:hypothetical protein
VTQAFNDVTDFVRAGLEQIKDDKKPGDDREPGKELVAKCEQPNVRCDRRATSAAASTS